MSEALNFHGNELNYFATYFNVSTLHELTC